MKTTKSPPRRPGKTTVGALARAIVLLLSLALVAYAAAPPAGAPIGNQATATYLDAGENQRTATSNQVITFVKQVAGLDLQADQSKLAAPGGQVYFPHTVTNVGNGADTYDLVWAHGSGFTLGSVNIYADVDGDGIPDNATPITSTGEIPAGGSFKFVVVGVIPGSTADEATSSGTITATSQISDATPKLSATNTDTVTVTATLPVINITKAMSPTSGPSPSTGHTVTFTYTNSGNSKATDLTVTDVLPVGMTYAGSARWSVTGNTDLTLGDVATTPDNSILVTQSGQTFQALIGNVQPGESRTITFKVNIATGVAAGVLANTGTFTFKNPDNSLNGPNDTNTVNFTVTTGSGVTIETDGPVPSAPQGGTAVFRNTVTNTGNAPDSFDITFNAGNTYPTGTTFALFKNDGNSPLVDTNGNGIPDTGLLAPGTSYDVVVKVTLPAGVPANPGPYSVTKRATSKNDPSKTDETDDALTSITKSSADLTNNAALGQPGVLGAGPGTTTAIVTEPANPGATVRFNLVANNTSTTSDTYNLSIPGLPADWIVVFRDPVTNAVITNTGIILAGGSKAYYADVTVPAGQAPGGVNLDFTIASPSSGATDYIRDVVTVNTVRNLALVPNHTGQIYPGGTVIYSHTLTNQGNVPEGGASSNIALTLADSLSGWGSVVYQDVNGNGIIDANDKVLSSAADVPAIAPGSSIALIVKVSAPPGAGIGQINVTTLTGTTTGGPATVPAVVKVTDTTTVISSDLQLVKEQAYDANGNGTGLTWTTGSLGSVPPGGIIRYRLTVINNGTANATDVKIYDSTPAFTSYIIAGSAATVTPGSLTLPTTTPGNGYTGPLEFTVGTLAPGASAVATFGVKINQ